MNASLERRRAPCGGRADGMRLALDCARNVQAVIDRRMPEASALASWLVQNAIAFWLDDAAVPADPENRRGFRGKGISIEDWCKIDAALASAAAVLPADSDAPADQWIATIGSALGLDALSLRLLALALHYRLDKRVEELLEAMSQCRGGTRQLSRGTAARLGVVTLSGLIQSEARLVLAGVRHETVPAYATHHAARHRTMLRPPILRQSPQRLRTSHR